MGHGQSPDLGRVERIREGDLELGWRSGVAGALGSVVLGRTDPVLSGGHRLSTGRRYVGGGGWGREWDVLSARERRKKNETVRWQKCSSMLFGGKVKL